MIINDFNMVKHILPADTNVNNESSPDKINNVVIGEYENLCEYFWKHAIASF